MKSYEVLTGIRVLGVLTALALLSTNLTGQAPPTIQATVVSGGDAPSRLASAGEIAAIQLLPKHTGKSERIVLFDGKTLDGWEGNPDWWSVKDGALDGKAGSKVPTSFLFTKQNFSDFRLTLWSRMVESDNHAGVCFWGMPATQGENKWYTKGPLVIFPNPSMWDYSEGKGLRVYRTTMTKVTNQHDWVQVEVLAQGNRVRAAFNGIQVLEWREANPERIKEGPVGVQLHAWNGPQEVQYRDIVVETFPKEDRLLTVTQ
jgi:3-keto-disaccharide hydrolase